MIVKNKIALVVVAALFSSGSAFAATAGGNKVMSQDGASTLSARTASLERQVNSLQHKLDVLQKKDGYTGSNLDLLMDAHGPAVFSSPAFGVRRSAEDANDLMVNLSSINEDLLLLKLRQKMENYATEKGIKIPERPIIALSGSVEGQVDYKRNHKYQNTERTNINLSRAELDVISEAGPWATAAMIISYDDLRPDNIPRSSYARFRLDRGFLTIGQLNKFPLYLTIGQVYAPFGSFSSYMITTSSPKKLGRMKDRMIILGGQYNGISAQIYGFPGETNKGNTTNSVLARSGANLGYEYEADNFRMKLGGSIMGSLADSDGMQYEIFRHNENVSSHVPAVDGRVKISYNAFNFLAEYVSAVKPFNINDLSFKGKGAKPQALNVEAAVEFRIKDKPNNFAVGYGQTWQALALELPRHTFFAMYDIAIVKNTIFGIEYRHDINYGNDDYAAGGNGKKSVTVKTLPGSRHSNIVTAKLAVYF